MKYLLLLMSAAALLVACGTSAPASAPTVSAGVATAIAVPTSAPLPTEGSAPVATAGSSPNAAGEANTVADAAFWQAIGCIKAANCTPIMAERVVNSQVELWCVIAQGPRGPISRTFRREGEAWAESFALRDNLLKLGCNDAVAELDRVVTAATAAVLAVASPTQKPLEGGKVIGEPLPDGTLEISECYPSRGCVAVLTEDAPNNDVAWCVVLERDGERQAWLFLKNVNTVPTAMPSNAKGFESNGCTNAAAALTGDN